MVGPDKQKNVAEAKAEGAVLLALARAQLERINQALASHYSSDLSSAKGRVREAMISISSAMASGDTAGLSSSLDSLMNIDVSTAEADNAQSVGNIAANMAVAGASVDINMTVTRDLNDMHMFDDKVRQNMTDAQWAKYKKDEQDIHDLLAKHTTEDDLKGAGKMEGHLLEAYRSGGGDDKLMQIWNDTNKKTEALHAAMRKAGMSTAEYDAQVYQDSYNFLKDRGLNDQQIKAAFAKSANPLDAVKPYVTGDGDSRRLADSLRSANKQGMIDLKKVQDIPTTTAGQGTGSGDQPKEDKPIILDAATIADTMNAKIAATGLSNPSTPAETSSGHGLSIQKPVSSQNATLGHN